MPYPRPLRLRQSLRALLLLLLAGQTLALAHTRRYPVGDDACALCLYAAHADNIVSTHHCAVAVVRSVSCVSVILAPVVISSHSSFFRARAPTDLRC